jgi:hypothetical protein
VEKLQCELHLQSTLALHYDLAVFNKLIAKSREISRCIYPVLNAAVLDFFNFFVRLAIRTSSGTGLHSLLFSILQGYLKYYPVIWRVSLSLSDVYCHLSD